MRGVDHATGQVQPRRRVQFGQQELVQSPPHAGLIPIPQRAWKHHLITDRHGSSLAVLLTGGIRNDVTQLLLLLDAIPPVCGRVDRPRRKPDSLFADRRYDHDIYRDQVRARGVVPAIARRDTQHGTGLGTYRCVMEKSFAWLHGFRRLRIRWERRADIHDAFLKLACCPITHRHSGHCASRG